MKTQWQNYQELEQIPDSVLPPLENKSELLIWLNNRWLSLLNKLAGKFDYEKQVDHLEDCLELKYPKSNGKPGLGRKIWEVLNRPIGSTRLASVQHEPEIKQVADTKGQTWWEAYDPITGQITYLESEEEVQIWLEERLYF